ncbi:conserved hypothetical protein [Vibrio phage 277E43-1]|nr:conserved hypothetical protein [Vibrio phage 277E43-1]
MLQTNISFNKAIETVEHFHSTDKKGKTELQKCQFGFTCYANAIKVLTQYRDLAKFSVPSKSTKAEEVLSKIEEGK